MHRLLLVSLVLPALCIHAQTFSPPQLDHVEQLLQQLSDAPGPPGAEEAVRAIMLREMTPFATKPASFDGIGSVIFRQGSTGPVIMVDAHMDEVGAMVRRITPDGFLRIQLVGTWIDQTLIDQRWIILTSKGPIHAISGMRDYHIVPIPERLTLITRDEVYLDIGASSAEEVAALGIKVGDPIAPDSPFQVLPTGHRYLGKAWDDRVGCAVMIEAMVRLAKLPHANQIVWVATVQEEQGLRGARPSAHIVKPDLAIALEGGIVNDTPANKPEDPNGRLGMGPSLVLRDAQGTQLHRLVDLIRQVAVEKHIPLQERVNANASTDGQEMQTANAGDPEADIVVPVRSTHSHNGVIDRSDFDRAVDLLVAVLQSLDEKTVREFRDFSH